MNYEAKINALSLPAIHKEHLLREVGWQIKFGRDAQYIESMLHRAVSSVQPALDRIATVELSNFEIEPSCSMAFCCGGIWFNMSWKTQNQLKKILRNENPTHVEYLDAIYSAEFELSKNPQGMYYVRQGEQA